MAVDWGCAPEGDCRDASGGARWRFLLHRLELARLIELQADLAGRELVLRIADMGIFERGKVRFV